MLGVRLWAEYRPINRTTENSLHMNRYNARMYESMVECCAFCHDKWRLPSKLEHLSIQRGRITMKNSLNKTTIQVNISIYAPCFRCLYIVRTYIIWMRRILKKIGKQKKEKREEKRENFAECHWRFVWLRSWRDRAAERVRVEIFQRFLLCV